MKKVDTHTYYEQIDEQQGFFVEINKLVCLYLVARCYDVSS